MWHIRVIQASYLLSTIMHILLVFIQQPVVHFNLQICKVEFHFVRFHIHFVRFHIVKAMKNETLTLSGLLFNYIFDPSQGQWLWTPTVCIWSLFKLLLMLNWVKNDTAVYQNLNWSQSFPSVLNSNSYPGPGINKSQCQDNCGQYSFSMRPERYDFPLMRIGLTISSVLIEFWITMDQ